MIFLGKASNYTAQDVFKHTFAHGGEDDIAELRATLAAHYGATYDHVAVYHNGRSALAVAIKSLTRRGGKVIITSLTCHAVVQAVKAAGCVPIFADIDRDTLHFGVKELENAFTGESDVQAVIVQNNLGNPVDIKSIEAFCKKHKLVLIEDLAHCAGVKYSDGRECGTVGRAVALSFGKGKSIDTISGGAVIFTNRLDNPVKQPTVKPSRGDQLRDRFYPLFGQISRGLYHIHPKLGGGFMGFLLKTNQVQRSADAKLDNKVTLPGWQAKLAVAKVQKLSHRGRPPIREHFFVANREECLRKLAGVGYYLDETWYEAPVSPIRYYHNSGFREDACPVATEVATQIINLPTWYDDNMELGRSIIEKYLFENYKGPIKTAAEAATESRRKAINNAEVQVNPSGEIQLENADNTDELKRAQAVAEMEELAAAKGKTTKGGKSAKVDLKNLAELAKEAGKKAQKATKEVADKATKKTKKADKAAKPTKQEKIEAALESEVNTLEGLEYLSVLDKNEDDLRPSQSHAVAAATAPIYTEEPEEEPVVTKNLTPAQIAKIETQKAIEAAERAKKAQEAAERAEAEERAAIKAKADLERAAKAAAQAQEKPARSTSLSSGTMRSAPKKEEKKPETAAMSGMMKTAARKKTAVELAKEARAAGKGMNNVA